MKLLVTSKPRARSMFFVKMTLVSSSEGWLVCWLHRDVFDQIDWEILEQRTHGKVRAKSVFTALVAGDHPVIPPDEADNPLWLRVIKYRLTCVNATKNAEQ